MYASTIDKTINSGLVLVSQVRIYNLGQQYKLNFAFWCSTGCICMYVVGITPLIKRIKLTELLYSTNCIETQQHFVVLYLYYTICKKYFNFINFMISKWQCTWHTFGVTCIPDCKLKLFSTNINIRKQQTAVNKTLVQSFLQTVWGRR